MSEFVHSGITRIDGDSIVQDGNGTMSIYNISNGAVVATGATTARPLSEFAALANGAAPVPAQNAATGRNPITYGIASSEVFNLKASNTQYTRRAISRVMTGSGRGTIACCGDSTTRGIGSGTGNTQYINIKHNSYPFRLAQILSSAGLPATADNFYGTGGDGETIAQVASESAQISIGADWAISPLPSVGGQSFQQSAGTSSLAYTPATPWDTAKYLYFVGTTGIMELQPGAVTVNTAANPSGLTLGTLTQGLGTAAFSITWKSGATVYPQGFHFYNSAIPQLDILDLGWGGSTSVDWARAGTLNPLTGLAALAPDLTIIDLGINDWIVRTAASTFSANIQTLITQALSTGDCWLVAPIPSSPSAIPIATQATYISALYALAVTNDIPLIDLTHRVGSWAEGNSLGLYWDNLHHNPLGYLDDAKAFAKVFQGL